MRLKVNKDPIYNSEAYALVNIKSFRATYFNRSNILEFIEPIISLLGFRRGPILCINPANKSICRIFVRIKEHSPAVVSNLCIVPKTVAIGI